jgi:hypothetical protein
VGRRTVGTGRVGGIVLEQLVHQTTAGDAGGFIGTVVAVDDEANRGGRAHRVGIGRPCEPLEGSEVVIERAAGALLVFPP